MTVLPQSDELHGTIYLDFPIYCRGNFPHSLHREPENIIYNLVVCLFGGTGVYARLCALPQSIRDR